MSVVRNAAAVAVLGFALGIATSCADDNVRARERSTSGAATTVELSERFDPVIVPIDAGVFVWGGNRVFPEGGPDPGEFVELFLDDGAMFTTAGRVGTAVAPAVFPAPLLDADGVAVGDEIVVGGATCAEAADVDSSEPDCRPDSELVVAAYDPARNTWRELSLPEELREPAYAIWFLGATDDGRAVARVTAEGAPSLWMIDVETDTWTPVETALEVGGVRDCVTGDQLVQLSSPTQLTVVELAGTSRFSAHASALLPGEPPLDLTVSPMVCTDDAVHFFVNGVVPGSWQPDPGGGRSLWVELPDRPHLFWTYHPKSDTWSRSADGPMPDLDSLTIGVWSGEEVLLFDTLEDQPGLAYNPSANSWRPLDPPGLILPDVVEWTDDGIPVWSTGGLELIDAGA